MQIAEDSKGDKTYEQLDQLSWAPTNSTYFNQTFSTSVFWLRATVTRTNEQTLLMMINQSAVDYLDVWLEDADGKVTSYWQTGDLYPHDSRPLQTRGFVFPIAFKSNAPYTITIRLDSMDSHNEALGISLVTQAHYQASNQQDMLVYGLYFGALLALFFYNLIVWFSHRDKSFLLYAIYLFWMALCLFTYRGYGYLYLWPEAIWFNSQIVPISNALLCFSLFVFSAHLLEFKKYLPRLNRYLKGFAMTFWIPVIMALFDKHGTIYYLLTPQVLLLFITLIAISAYLSFQRHPIARLYFITWMPLVLGTCVFYLVGFSDLPINSSIVGYSVEIGSFFEIVLLAFTLAYKLNLMDKAKQQAEKDTLEAQRTLSKNLEKLVIERTAELQQSRTQYKNLYEQTAEQKIQTEAAYQSLKDSIQNNINFIDMISHEYRTPLSVIESGLALIDKSDELKNNGLLTRMRMSSKRLLHLFETALTDNRINNAHIKLNKRKVEVSSLLTLAIEYTRSCHEEHMLDDIQLDGLQSIETMLDPDLINIVFTNILDNACKYSEPEQPVRIELNLDNENYLVVQITDSGSGIAANEQARIFEKFYRSKSAGNKKGVGVGLYLVKKIVELHDGNITVNSALNHGTEVSITLPLTGHTQ